MDNMLEATSQSNSMRGPAPLVRDQSTTKETKTIKT